MPYAISVFGAGSWGTALSLSLASQGHSVTLWARRPEIASGILETRHNPDYLTDAEIPVGVEVQTDLACAAESSDYWVIAIPSHAVRSIAKDLFKYADRQKIVICVAKGIEIETEMTMTQVLADVMSSVVPEENFVALYGPSHAEEVAVGKPTALVAAASKNDRAELVQRIFMKDRLRIYVNTDLLGVEIGGSVKNIIAIASGISDGLGFGDNTRATLITRGIAEIQRLGSALGAEPSTFAGLTGLGDLVATCTSSHSRNRYLGEAIGRGESLDHIMSSMNMIAEGVKTTKAVYHMALRHGVDMPITEAIYKILFEELHLDDLVQRLMSRSAKQEDRLSPNMEMNQER